MHSSSLARSTLTFVTFVAISSALLSIPVLGSNPEVKSRLTCTSSEDCERHDRNKECIRGECYCKPYFDDNSQFDNVCMKSHGGKCSPLELCNVHKLLTCDHPKNGICHCLDKVNMIYDEYQGKCVGKLGELCEFEGWADVQRGCVQNAICVDDEYRSESDDGPFFGICDCVEGFVEKGDSCVPEIGSKCDFDQDCDNVGVKCTDGKCACELDRLYNEDEHECELRAGSTCEVGEDSCVEHANCAVKSAKGERRHDWRLECICDLGFHDDGSGACVQDTPNECGVVKGGREEDVRIFDKERGRCSTRVGGECVTYGKNRCVSFAYCGTGNTCECYEGYEISKDLTCVNETIQMIELSRANHHRHTPHFADSKASIYGVRGAVIELVAVAVGLTRLTT